MSLESDLTKLEAWQSAMTEYMLGVIDVTMPHHRMGVHWIPASNRAADHAYMSALRPGVLKIVSLDANRIREASNYLDPASASVLVLRDHPLSEQHADMNRDPVGTGQRHAIEWAAKLNGYLSFLPKKRIAVCGINEPYVRTAAEEEIAFRYTMAFLQELTKLGIRGLALNLSVGWPRNTGPDTIPRWEPFLPLEPVIVAGNHFLCLHEYWRNDPDDSWYQAPDGRKWGWTAHRHHACPMSVPIIIGECGMSKRVNGQPAPNQPVGWVGNIPPATYAEQLWRYEAKCHPNVLGIMPFTTDSASVDWKDKDTITAHNDILARKHPHAWPVDWPVEVTDPEPPSPEPGDPTVLILPSPAKVTGFYGQLYTNSAGAKYAHEGLDLSRVEGRPIYAPADGVVAWSDWDNAYGNYVRTYHPDFGVCFFFAHLSERMVQRGATLKAGQQIGKTGNTGNSTGPHLHVEVRAMTEAGAYKAGWSAHGNARNDVLSFITGWLAAGNTVDYYE